MDKVEKIRSYLKDIKETTASDLQSVAGRVHFKNLITSIDSLLTGCLDGDDVLVLYDRCQLDDYKSQFTNKPATWEEWNNFKIHKDIDYAYEHASEYLGGAESDVIDEEKYLEEEGDNG
jgi:hypothetical protein